MSSAIKNDIQQLFIINGKNVLDHDNILTLDDFKINNGSLYIDKNCINGYSENKVGILLMFSKNCPYCLNKSKLLNNINEYCKKNGNLYLKVFECSNSNSNSDVHELKKYFKITHYPTFFMIYITKNNKVIHEPDEIFNDNFINMFNY